MMSPSISLILGTANYGEPGTPNVRLTTLEECQQLVDAFTAHGQAELDTSNRYAAGTSEQYLSKLNLKGALVDTKACPFKPGDHSAGNLRAAVEKSAQTLAPNKINILYLHIPDRSVPYEETVRELDVLHKRGLFKEWGLSNYAAHEVAEICTIAKYNGWVLPSVYQGRYNAIERMVEPELFPCLRKYRMRFYAYSPLAGGLLTGKYLNNADLDNVKGGRFDPSTGPFSAHLRAMYTPYLPVLKELNDVLIKFNLSMPEASYRWLQHHSIMSPDLNDKVILGASSLSQLETGLKQCNGPPLPKEVVDEFENTWKKIKGLTSPYYLV